MIEIWNPRWHDRKVLIAKHKVTAGVNEIVFTKAKSLPGRFQVLGSEIVKHPLESNGTIDCYAVPLDSLLRVE